MWLIRPKQNICVFPISRPTHHFLGDRLMFFYCATQSFFIGDHVEKKKVNRTTLREVMRFWRQNFLKLVQILTLVLNIWREISLKDNTKIVHPFFAYRLKVFLLRIIYKTKNDINRTTLKEVLRFLSQNLSKISLEGQYKKYCNNKKFPTYLLGFVGPWNRKHTYLFFA